MVFSEGEAVKGKRQVKRQEKGGVGGGSLFRGKLGGGFKYFFSPLLGEDEPILTNIFQMGWNHQLDKNLPIFVVDGFNHGTFTYNGCIVIW